MNGWDRWIDSNYRYSYLAGISYTSRDTKTSLSSVILTGPDQLPRYASANSPFLPTGVVTNSVLQGRANPYYGKSNRTYMSNVVSHAWSSKLPKPRRSSSSMKISSRVWDRVGRLMREATRAHGTVPVIDSYQVTPKLTGVYRAEIFRDQNGAATSSADNYYEQTIGLIFKPKPWIWLRPEVRYDWAQFHTPFSDGTRGSQLTLGFDIIFQSLRGLDA